MRTPSENSFTTHDDSQLFYRHWPATGQRRGAIVLLHRGHEHGGRVAHLADELDLPDFDVFAWDARGNGKSPGARGDSPSFSALVRDLECFVRHMEAQHGVAPQDMAVVAQSVGAVVAATWVHDYAPKIRALVLASPAFKVKLYVPLARPALRLRYALGGNFEVQSYVKAKFLTHDPARIASYDADPLITRAIAVNMLLGLYEAGERVVEDAAAITLPVLVLVSGADFVVHSTTKYFDGHNATVGGAMSNPVHSVQPGADCPGEGWAAVDQGGFVCLEYAVPSEGPARVTRPETKPRPQKPTDREPPKPAKAEAPANARPHGGAHDAPRPTMQESFDDAKKGEEDDLTAESAEDTERATHALLIYYLVDSIFFKFHEKCISLRSLRSLRLLGRRFFPIQPQRTQGSQRTASLQSASLWSLCSLRLPAGGVPGPK